MTIPNSPRPPQIRVEHLRKRAAVYARQSTPEQVRENTGSTADQRALVEMAQQWWDPSQVKLFEDLGLSGTSTANRPSYLDMLEGIRAGELGAVFAQDVSRLTRVPRDGEELTIPSLEVATRAGAAGAWRSARVFPSAGTRFDDKPAIAVDTSAESPHLNRVYIAWSRLSRRTRSGCK